MPDNISEEKNNDIYNHNPSGKPVDKRVETHPVVSQTLGKIMRMGILSGALALGIFGTRELIQHQNIANENPENIPAQPLEKAAPENYDEWSSKIKLPQVDINFDATPLTATEVDNHFLDPKINRPRLQLLYDTLNEIREDFDQKISEKQDPMERQAEIINYLSTLIRGYCWITGKQIPQAMDFGSEKFHKLMIKISGILIPSGKWITIGPTQGLEAYDINKILPIHVNGKPIREVMILLKNHKSYAVDPKKSGGDGGIGGEYFDGMQYMTVDLESGEKAIKEVASSLGYPQEGEEFKNLMDAVHRAMVAHEVMHIVMAQNFGLIDNTEHRAKKMGNINLGQYSLTEGSYTWADSHQIHKLASIGFSLINSRESAKVMLIATSLNGGEDCHLSNVIALYELQNSKYTTPENKQRIGEWLNGAQGERRKIAAIIKEMPNEEILRIGEVMAKLAIHLVQPNE